MDANEIKYAALNELGYTEEPDFDADEDNAVNAMNLSYTRISHLALTSYDWSFARKVARLDAVPSDVGKYKYYFVLPVGWLYIRGVYSDENLSRVIDNYERNDDRVYCDSPTMWVEYTAEINETDLPAYFVEYLIYLLARKNCTKITGDKDLLQEMIQNEQMSFNEAKNTDIKQQKVRILDTGVFTDVRN